MPRRVESPEGALARDKIKARYERLQTLTDAFFDASARVERLREQLDRIDGEQRRHVAELAVLTDPGMAADLTGWSLAQVRAAVNEQRQARSALRAAGATTEPITGDD